MEIGERSALGRVVDAGLSQVLVRATIVGMTSRPSSALVLAGLLGASLSSAGCFLSHERAEGCEPVLDMVAIGAPDASHHMGVTEVTQEEYARFLRCAPADAPVPDSCDGYDRGPCEQWRFPFDPIGAPRLPVQCVSWCAASAYCAWAGARLCTVDEWSAACEATALRVAPGGRVRGPRWCVLAEYADGTSRYEGGDQREDVSSAPDCRADAPPYDQISDLIGNVEELVDDCGGGMCRFAGGSYNSGRGAPCMFEGGLAPSEGTSGVGFRCCADPR
jgi:formylglycine-generating enzyme required for sulfatase activity